MPALPPIFGLAGLAAVGDEVAAGAGKEGRARGAAEVGRIWLAKVRKVLGRPRSSFLKKIWPHELSTFSDKTSR